VGRRDEKVRGWVEQAGRTISLQAAPDLSIPPPSPQPPPSIPPTERPQLQGRTPLMTACHNGHLGIAKALVAAGCNKETVGGGKTALSIATEKGLNHISSFLVGGCLGVLCSSSRERCLFVFFL